MPQEPSFADEVVQDELPKHIETPRDEFLPWHRVRKEFIRRHQWNELAIQMIKRHWNRQLQQEESEWSLEDPLREEGEFSIPPNVRLENVLRCLVIPGEDLLDVRALWRDVNEFNCFIVYLGFNEGQGSDQKGTRIHVANNDVTSLTGIRTDSRVLHDRFEVIASQNSQAYRYLKEYGPYHIVNLDLCGSMFPNTLKDPTDYYSALNQLLAFQFERQRSEWLLFISTIIEPGVVDLEGLARLCGPAKDNYAKHEGFAHQMKQVFPEELFGANDQSLNLGTLTNEQMVQLFGVSLGKWLLALCQRAKPQWIVAMRRSYRYVINHEKGAYLLSLAFELKPIVSPPVDETGMASLSLVARKHPDERECAIQLVKSVIDIRDVDEILTSNKSLKTDLTNAQAELLEASGYDRQAYLKWIETEEPTPKE